MTVVVVLARVLVVVFHAVLHCADAVIVDTTVCVDVGPATTTVDVGPSTDRVVTSVSVE
jgi:hypothetical protein